MNEIGVLTQRIAALGRSVDRWNGVMLWGLAFAAAAAIVVGISTRLIVLRTGQQADSQTLLSAAKDRELRDNLAQKEADIAGLN